MNHQTGTKTFQQFPRRVKQKDGVKVFPTDTVVLATPLSDPDIPTAIAGDSHALVDPHSLPDGNFPQTPSTTL